MRIQLQLQGIVLILFGMLLAMISVSGPAANLPGGILQLILLGLALLSGLLGLMLSLSRDRSGQ